MKTKILLLVIIAFCSVNLISQNAHTKLVNPDFRGSLDRDINHQYRPLKDAVNQGVDEGLAKSGSVAYGYVLWDPTGELPPGPCFFDLDDPGTITSLATTTAGDFLSAGTWADGKWYCEEYGVGNLYEINPFDGSMTFIGSSGYSIGDIVWDGTTMYACAGGTFGSINLEDGSATIIGSIGNTGYMIGMGCDAAGNIYGVDFDEDNLYSIDKVTGAGTIIGPLGINLVPYAQDMDFDRDNNVLYLAARVYGQGAFLYTVNTSTGAATLVGGFMNDIKIDALAIPYVGVIYTNDVAVVSIPSPSSGMLLTDEEPVVALINNFGTEAQSNFDISFTLNGGTAVTETVTATINGGETYEYTFPTTIDLSAFGEYTIEICTDLASDENPGNNCLTKMIMNSEFDYCDASSSVQYEFISNVLFGEINNSSGWQGGVADYTGISTKIEVGIPVDITVTNGYPEFGDYVNVWVDWNNDTVFQKDSEEEIILNNNGTGEFFTGSIEAPAGTPDGEYRMRVRLVWNAEQDPCGLKAFGEVEDYTVIMANPISIDENSLSNTRVFPNPASEVVNFESDNLMKYVSVFNQTGQKVFSGEMDCKYYRLNTSGFTSGVYHFLIHTDEGTVSGRIVIK